MTDRLPSIEDIEAARTRCGARLRHTPLLRSAALERRIGGAVLLKAENLQHTGSFKLRGAMNAVLALVEQGHKGGIVAFSSGNHAQATAYAAAAAGLKATIFMPADAPAIKTRLTKSWGAEVVPFNRLTDDREALARAECERTGGALIPPYDHFQVMSGQGTAGLEIAEDARASGLTVDALLAPVSGGGLLAGTTLAVQSRFPDAKTYAVEPEGRDDMRRSLLSGAREVNGPDGSVLCDGLLSPQQGELTFAVNKDHVAGGVVVTDDAVLQAMAFAFLHMKLVLEPSGAIGLAALLSGAFDGRDKTTAIILSGGNVDPETFQRALAYAGEV
ncbi:threonine ammonia-lyase [Acidisoma cellulosilyticum]|uniref:threonine ammonia-lyase n=1 Tax=Acidisoma cellulosilyticum TaxID=2802395 RepID=UPI001D0B2A9C|nr:threonine/serine dehydratase [Acidisoma cellulosilyticum]